MLESIAYRTRDILEIVSEEGISLLDLRVDGGLTNNRFLMHFLADLIQKNVVKAEVIDSTCLGAAFVVGLQTGIFQSFQ